MKNLKVIFLNRLQSLYLTLLVIFLSVLDIKYRSGPALLRMAIANSDDNPIVYSLVRSNAQKFELDYYARIIADIQQNSIISKIGHYALKYGILDEKNLWVTLLFTQKILLYGSIYFLIARFIKSDLHATLLLVIFSSTPVYYWNLGWFGALDDQPYPMWMALPLIILGITFLTKNFHKRLHLVIFLTVLIHPSIGLMFAGWVFFHFLFSRDRNNMIRFFISAILNLSYVLTIKLLMPDQAKMPISIKNIALTNPHVDFFNIFSTDYQAASLRIWVLILCFSILAIIYERQHSRIFAKNLVLSLSIYCSILLVFQAIGLWTSQLLIISMLPARFSIVLVTVAFVIVISHVSKDLLSKKLLNRLTSFIFLIFPSPGIALLFLLKKIGTGSSSKKIIMFGHFIAILMVTLIGYLASPNILSLISNGTRFTEAIYASYVHTSYLNPLRTGFMNYIVPALFSKKSIQISFIFLFAILLVAPYLKAVHIKSNKYLKKDSIQNIFSYLGYAVSISFIVIASKLGMDYQLPFSYGGSNITKVISYTEAQIWARGNTPETSIFFIDGSLPGSYAWRTLSERPVSNPNLIFSFYNYPSYVDEFNKDREDFWISNLKAENFNYYGQWNENFFCLSQDLNMVSFVVQNFNQKPLFFPVVYRNRDFLIYKVKCD